MKHAHIGNKDRVWTIMLGPDGKLREELDCERLAALRCNMGRLAA
jgi:hypothetical protein